MKSFTQRVSNDLSALLDKFNVSMHPKYRDSGHVLVSPGAATFTIDGKPHLDQYDAKVKEELRQIWRLYPGLRPLMGGAAGNWTFPDSARADLINGTFDIDTDSFKCALFLSTSDIGASSTTYAGVTNEHSNANGYTTGGIAITLTIAGTTTVTVDISTDPVWTASGGSITARFAVIYEVAGRVLCYALLDSTPADVTATSGNTLTVAANASGVFTLA